MNKGTIRLNKSKFVITLDVIEYQVLAKLIPKKLWDVLISSNLKVKNKIKIYKLK